MNTFGMCFHSYFFQFCTHILKILGIKLLIVCCFENKLYFLLCYFTIFNNVGLYLNAQEKSAFDYLIQSLFHWIILAINDMNLHLRNTSIVSHEFEFDVYSFSFNSTKPLMAFLISILTHFSFRSALFFFHGFISFCYFCCWRYPASSMCWDRLQGVISVFLCLLRLVLCPSM